MNEAEVRAKIVDLWLRDHGFTAGQIVLEKTFSIRLGRGLYEVGKKRSSRNDDLRGRADYLVRSSDGRNLFIVEAKAAEEEIDDDSCRQAISYARLLDQGGIAPFVVVTNGTQTRIIDSITRESLQGHCIPTSHPYISAGFRVSVDDLTYRTEALEQLICLSPENFLAFCRLQSDMRMARLRSNDITSGFKYIPSLYVERQTAHKELTNLIETDGKCVILLGPPQVGKTNFLCHFVEAQLALGTPCLFYPAIGMDSGLLDAIREDFDWTFSEAGSISQMVRQKLRRVLENSCKKLLLVVEGLNENQNFVNAFTAECERLQSEKICLILSFTTHSAASILLDAAGNPTYAARATGIHKRDIPVLQMNPLAHSNHRAVVNIGVFSEEEIETAYSTYSDAFRVVVPGDHGRTSEPLVLRIAMERFQGQHLPVKLDAAELLDWTIN